MVSKYIRENAVVEFSDTACLQASTGYVWSAFQRNSYIARVRFLDDGRTVCVALPSNARAEKLASEYVNDAIAAASDLPDGGAAYL